ncbi:nuclease-related domain-containing protein [Bacillus sp. J33]|uniref:nuclease-related domain-containing protein n=1 Tax=Bacillus sp. J33 TaxID=935836 RepID=UPI0018DCB467|nr:nuclease-related domain-containing protein [Bacillus sp. J33]
MRSEIEKDQAKRWAGHRGESSLDFHLGKLPEKEYIILHGIRLTNRQFFFQIDTLILSKKFALILEVKNLIGKIYFDPQFNQMIQTTPYGEEKGYSNPIEQASQQARELQKWLTKRGFHLPVDYFVVFSKPSTILQSTSGNNQIHQKVIHAQYLVSKTEKLGMTFKENYLEYKVLKKISKNILKEHTPETFDILNFYKISKNEIIKGVLCPVCISEPMTRRDGVWICKACRIKSSDAHIKTITDLFLLNNGEPITNMEFREFLQLSSPHISRRLLESLNLPQTGTNKGRRYHPPPNYQNMTDLNFQQY